MLEPSPEATPWVEPPLPQPPGSIQHLTKRVQRLIQDLTEACFSGGQVRRQILTEVERLARQQLFGKVLWIQGMPGKAIYRLDDHGMFIYHTTASRMDLVAYPDKVSIIRDGHAAYQTYGVQVGDLVRCLSNGTVSRVTRVISQTLLECANGFRGFDLLNEDLIEIQDGDQFIIERRLPPESVVSIRAVSYSGRNLQWVSSEQFDRLHAGANRQTGVPRYWSTDGADLPTHIKVFPPPHLLGPGPLSIPMNPASLPWVSNLVAFMYVNPHPHSSYQIANDEGFLQKEAGLSEITAPVQTPRAFHQPIVLRTAAALLANEGPCQNLPTAQACLVLSRVYLSMLGVNDG